MSAPAANRTETDIAGAVFSVHPMSDQFVDIILGAIDQTDLSRVWRQTDTVATTVRGKAPHVFDAVHCLYARVAASGAHSALNATFSIGCPGDTEGHAAMEADNNRPNHYTAAELSGNVSAKFALYPMSGGEYMPVIMDQIEQMKATGLSVELVHYCTHLEGELKDVFAGLENVFLETAKVSNHVVMTLQLSNGH